MHTVRAVATLVGTPAFLERFVRRHYREVGNTVMLFERCSEVGRGKGDDGADARRRAAARRYSEIGE